MAEYDPVRDYGKPHIYTPVEPKSLPEPDPSEVFTPKDALPVFVRLIWDVEGYEPRTVKGFASAWTRTAALVSFPWHIEYYMASIERWLPAEQVQRRTISKSTRPWYEQRYYGGR